MIFTNYTIFNFEGESRETKRSKNLGTGVTPASINYNERGRDVLTLFSRLYDLAVLRNPLSKSKNRVICENYGANFFDL